MALFSDPNFKSLRKKRKTRRLIKILLSFKNYNHMREAAAALGSIKDKKAVPALLETFNHHGRRLHTIAAEALGEIGDPRALDKLCDCLNSDKDDLCIAAAAALGKIGSEAAVPPMNDALKAKSPAVQTAILDAIGRIGGETALKTITRFLQNDDDQVAVAAVKALQSHGSEESVDLLKTLFESSGPVLREASAKALSNLGWAPDRKRADQWLETINVEDEIREKTIDIPPKLKSLIEGKSDLPPIPQIAMKLNEILKDPDCNIKEMVSLIKTDPVISARVVQVANSAYYSAGDVDVTDILTATTRLGLDQMQNLIFAYSIYKHFHGVDLIDKRKFWIHCFVSALIAQKISAALGQDREDRERAYMAGLMHDIGIMVIARIIPELYSRFLQTIGGATLQKKGYNLQLDEHKKFNTDHPTIGAAYIYYWWPVDNSIVKAVLDHHKNLNRDKLQLLSKITILANEYCHSAGLDNGVNFSPESLIFDYEKLRLLNMNDAGIEKFKHSIENEIDLAEMILNFGF